MKKMYKLPLLLGKWMFTHVLSFCSFSLLSTFFCVSLVAGDFDLMRRCLLLPVFDDIEGTIAFKVYESVENELKNSSWCYFRPNSEILTILQNYRDNLTSYLKNPDVLRAIAERGNAGSLIAVSLKGQDDGMEVQVEIFGSDGKTVYYREKEGVKSSDVDVIAQAVHRHLQNYRRMIPYDAQVVGVLGNQITFDVGRNYRVQIGKELTVKRLVRVVEHPLLKKVVSFESQIVASGATAGIEDYQSVGILKNYQGSKKIEKGDWVVLGEERKEAEGMKEDGGSGGLSSLDDDESKGYAFGKLGQLGLFMTGNIQGRKTQNIIDRSESGWTMGLQGEGELWLIRWLWLGAEVAREIGKYSPTEGVHGATSYSLVQGRFKLLAGYRYFPLGFFYGPRVDGYMGYANYSYALANSVADSIGAMSFGGFVAGARGELPFYRVYRFFVRGEMMLLGQYQESKVIMGSKTGLSSYQLEFGGIYQWDIQMSLEASFEMTGHHATFARDKDLQLSENRLKVGTSFVF